MSRLAPQDWSHIAARLPEEGLHRLYTHSNDDTYQNHPAAHRSLELVIPPLRKLFCELANEQKPWPLYLHGPAGHGKTAAVLAFCDMVAGARYWSLDTLLSTVVENPPWNYWGVRLAVLDEVGSVRTGKGRDWDYEIVKRFFEWSKDRATIYISNHPLSKIAKLYDSKIFSRLSSGTQFELVDRDRRQRK